MSTPRRRAHHRHRPWDDQVRAAIWQGDEPVVISSSEAGDFVPSVVAEAANGSRLVGHFNAASSRDQP